MNRGLARLPRLPADRLAELLIARLRRVLEALELGAAEEWA